MMKCQQMTGYSSFSKSTCGRTRRIRKRRPRLVKLQPVLSASAAVHISLAQWMKSNTHDFKWKCKLTPADFKGVGRGLQTRENLNTFDLIVSVPENLLITIQTALQSNVGEFLQRSKAHLTQQEIISLFLVMEKEKCEQSFWMPYIQTLPDTFTTPAYYSENDMLLLSVHLRKKAEKKIADLQQSYICLKSSLDLHWREMGAVLSYDKFRWAWYCVNSRSVYFKTEPCVNVRDDGNHMALAPFLDLLNHSCKAKVEAGFNSKTKCYEIRTLDKYKKYEQVFISYGPHDNHHLLMEYGFTLPDNSYDTYELDFDESIQTLSSMSVSNLEQKKKILQENKLRHMTCSIEGLSYEFWVILRILAMDWSELKNWRHALRGEEISACNTDRAKKVARHLLSKCIQDNCTLMKKFPERLSEQERIIYTVVKSEQKILQGAWTEVS